MDDNEDGLVNLQDLTFDFEDYFERHDAGNMSEDEKRDFSARIYGMFCRDFFNSSGDPGAIKPCVANYIAKKLYQVLGGVPWGDIMRMPWDEPTPFLTPRGERALNIYACIENALKDTPSANVTNLICEQSSILNVSYETARADYYAAKKWIGSGTGIPEKFLNNKV